MDFLADVKIPGRTQWSAIYNLTKGTVRICMEEKYDKVYFFEPGTL
jgi:hypothetical protein